MTAITFIFHEYLREMLRKDLRAATPFVHQYDRRASIKDVIESLGVPHPLVGRLTVHGGEVGFDYILRHGDLVEVYPLTPPVNPLAPDLLRPEALDRIAFVVDVNVGKLARLLRMLGFDTVYGHDSRNGRLAEIAQVEKRILLTRDTSLLKRKTVMHGYRPRQQNPAAQLIEVVRLYDLGSRVQPLSRCMACNGLLVPVSKEAIMARLEPLTRKYYESFRICEGCARIYWPGSHQQKIAAFTDEVLRAAGQDDALHG